ncbi:titin-like [Daphnia carinata]|uniref:titin-like n=1 Tax=Daphnia carinata TaxID=120202 RepID=UPI002580F476|nr:titin-like [Daphnia carinata]
MARYIALGIWTFIGTAILCFIVSTAHGFDSNAQSQFNSEEEVANRHSALGVRNSRRRAGGAIKYKKVSVMQSDMEKPDVFEVADMGQNKTRRLKTKTSHRHTMIYKPTKKRISQSKKNSFTSSTSTTQSPEVKAEELPDSYRRTKTWHQVQPVTEIIDSFIRPTKRNRLRVNSRQQTSTHEPTTTTLTPKVTKDPLRPISRVRSGAITTTTSKSTTSKFLRLDRKPNRWQSNASNENNRQQPTKISETSVTSTTESTTAIPEITTHPSREVFQVTPDTVPDPHDSSERPEIEHVKEESSIRKVAAKPDKIAYFDMNDPAANVNSGTRNSQERTVRPRIHVPKKDHDIQRPSQEPILLQTKEQREQQQLEASGKRKAEESAQLSRTRPRIPQSESNAQPQSETDEETERRHEKYEAEKSKQLERLRQTNVAGATQFEVDLPKARRIPSRTDYSNSAVQHSAPVKLNEESKDSGRLPPSAYGQRLPSSGHGNLPSADSRPSHPEFEASYPSPGHKPEQQRYTDSPSSYSERPPNRVRHRHPDVVTGRPDEDRRSTYKTTAPPIYGEEKYKRPELIYTPPEKEYQPPSAYLTGHGTYPRLRIVYQPASSSVPPPPVTYEPPHLEYMPPAASPPPRIYVPPVEDYKPPSTTAVLLHGRRQEEETPPARHPPRLEASRVNEDLRKLEESNTYTRLVSVGHPSIKELPYPPQRNAPSSRPAQTIEPAITEDPYIRTYERLQSVRDKGETLQEHPTRVYLQPAAPKSHVVEGTFIVDNTGTQINERPRPSYAGSSLIVGKPYYQKEEVPVKVNPYLSYRPSYDTEVTQKPYSPHLADVNTGRRYPDAPPSSNSGQQIHQSNPVYKAYQPSNAYQQQINEPFQPKEPRQLQQPAPVSEKPYIISWPERDDLEVADYRHENVIPVSEQPPYKPCDLPEVAALRLEKPLKEIPYVASEKPITVTVRPYGLATAESERNENLYRPPGRNSHPRSLSSEPRTNVRNDLKQTIDKEQQDDARDVAEQRPKHQSEQQTNIPVSFLPVGPVRAYQVTQAIYPSPPPRFLQFPAPLPNPFENQFASPATPPPTPPPPSSSATSDSFGSHNLPSGDTWSVNPLFPNQQQFPSSRPFTSSIQSQSPEEPVHSERIARYRSASTYRENQRLNRSLTYDSIPSYEQQQRPSDERVRETVRQTDVEDERYHQKHHDYNDPDSSETFHQQRNESLYDHREKPSYLQAPPGYEEPAIQNGRIHPFQEDPTDHDSSSSGGDFSGVKGIPGVDYPILHAIPNDLKFKCELVDSVDTHHPAYYADPYTRCQVFHVCQASRAKNSFLCPNGTIFNQKVRVCDWWHNVQCDESSAYYNVNDDNYQFKH